MLQFLSNPTVLWTTVAIFVALLWLWWRRPCSNFPPGPRGLPMVGVLFHLITKPQSVLRKWSFKYGPVSSARLGLEEVVFLNSYDSCYEALVKQASVFGGRAKHELFTSASGNNGLIMRRTDHDHKVQRAFLIQTLKHYGMGKKDMENIINEESQYFIDYLQTKTHKPFSLQTEVYKMVANVIMKIVVGERRSYDEKMFQKLCKAQNIQLQSPLQAKFIFVTLYFSKLLKYIPPFMFLKYAYQHAEKIIFGDFRPIIKYHRETFDPKSCRDYIDSYIFEQKSGETKEPSFTDRNLEASIADLFVAGTDTTSTLLSWLILGILNYPKYYKIIQNEIDINIGNTEPPSMKEIKKLPFLCAFIEETWRLFPVAPNALAHVTLKDTILYNYNIPKGTKVYPNLYTANLDPEIWLDPETFDPFRHIDENGKFVSLGKAIPFSLGTRSCPGKALATMEAPLFFAKLLQYYTIEPSPDGLPSMNDGVRSFQLYPKKYNVIMKPR